MGVRLPPGEIIAAAENYYVHAIRLSIISGAHILLLRDIIKRSWAVELRHIPIIIAGIMCDIVTLVGPPIIVAE